MRKNHEGPGGYDPLCFSLPKRFDIKDDEFNLVIFHRDFTPSIDRHVHRSQLYYLANGLCPYRKENRLAAELAVTGW